MTDGLNDYEREEYERWHAGVYRYAPRGRASHCRVLLLGENNPQSARAEHALYNDPPNCTNWRLQRILRLEDADFLGLWRTNLCCPTWSLRAARDRVSEITRADARGA